MDKIIYYYHYCLFLRCFCAVVSSLILSSLVYSMQYSYNFLSLLLLCLHLLLSLDTFPLDFSSALLVAQEFRVCLIEAAPYTLLLCDLLSGPLCVRLYAPLCHCFVAETRQQIARHSKTVLASRTVN